MAQLPPPGESHRAVECFCVDRTRRVVRQWNPLGVLLAAAALLAACSSAAPEQPATSRPSPSPSATVLLATLVPTQTPTPAVTPTATLSIDLEGSPLLEETFASAVGWPTGEAASGATTIMDGRLVVAIRQQLTSRLVTSPAEPAGGVFVEAEIEAQVCSPGDEYGLAFRIGPDQSYYRFTVGCDGSARLTRVLPDRKSGTRYPRTGECHRPGHRGRRPTGRPGLRVIHPLLRQRTGGHHAPRSGSDVRAPGRGGARRPGRPDDGRFQLLPRAEPLANGHARTVAPS